jgi:UPF0148 protein
MLNIDFDGDPMPLRKEDEIMAEYLLKGGKMLEKSCKTCGCPLFEVKGKTLCVVCAENETGAKTAKKPAGPADAQAPAGGCSCGTGHDEDICSCGEDHGEESCEGGMLTEEIAFTIHALCERIQNEKDPDHVLTLMNAVKAGTEALETLCRL